MNIDFRLLGPLEVQAGDELIHVGGGRQRIVLAVLLLEHRRVVAVDRLIDAVWDDEPPETARTQIQIAISELRRRLGAATDSEVIVTHPAGYSLRVPDEAFDVARFHRTVASGRDAVRRQDPTAGAAALRSALEMWRGDAAAGIDSRLVQAAAVRLNEERLAVLEECIGHELTLGNPDGVVGELRELLAAHPLREKLYAHLMLALYRAGRQAEAVAVYRSAHQLLVAEHGIDPGEELRALERAILANDPDLEAPAGPSERIPPRQLPAAPSDFVGRGEILAGMREQLAPTGGGGAPGQVQLVVINGPGGVGKTALALHAAHSVLPHYPDGQLFAHLRGSDAHPRHPADVLEQLLRALGVPPALLPSEVGELSALYRSRLADQRILVVLDDAAGAEQVAPLVPGDPGCALVLTSRSALPGLHGAHRFNLDVFEPADSLALLSQVIGERRVRAEAEATTALAESCGHLPLALRIASAKLSVRQHWQIARMVSRLRDERQRLDELTLDGVGVRASISLSFQGLDKPARRLLLLLGTLGAGDFAGWVAGPLLETDAGHAADVLDEVVESRLVDVNVDASGRVRYRLHDLIRIFAQEALAHEIPADERSAALHRLIRCWLFLAREAHRREHGGDFTVLRSGAEPWPLPAEVVDDVITDPIEWFHSERGNLVGAVNLAARLNREELCWELAMRSVTFFESRADRDAWHDTHETALAAARRAGNQRGEAAMRYSRASLAIAEQRLGDAQQDLEPALAWFTQAGDAHGRGLALRHLAFIDRLQGRYTAALDRYAAALSDLREVGDSAGEAHLLSNLAQIHLDHDRFDEAERLLHEALAICERVGARRVAAQVQYRLGHCYLDQADLVRAEAAFAAVLRVVDDINDPVGRAYALLGIGNVQLGQQESGPAGVSLREALEIMRQSGHQLGVGQALLGLAELSLGTGDTAAGAAYLAEAEALLTDIGVSVWRTRAERLRSQLQSAQRTG